MDWINQLSKIFQEIIFIYFQVNFVKIITIDGKLRILDL